MMIIKNIIIFDVIIKSYNYFWCNYKSINNYCHGRVYYLIKHVRLSIFIDHECFLCFNKYKIMGKGLGKKSYFGVILIISVFLCLIKYK